MYGFILFIQYNVPKHRNTPYTYHLFVIGIIARFQQEVISGDIPIPEGGAHGQLTGETTQHKRYPALGDMAHRGAAT